MKSRKIIKKHLIAVLEEIMEQSFKGETADEAWDNLLEFLHENDVEDDEQIEQILETSDVREDIADVVKELIMNWISDHGGVAR